MDMKFGVSFIREAQNFTAVLNSVFKSAETLLRHDTQNN
jgi:hypothetical protein